MDTTNETCKITSLIKELEALRQEKEDDLLQAQLHDYVNGYHHADVQLMYRVKKILDKYKVDVLTSTK